MTNRVAAAAELLRRRRARRALLDFAQYANPTYMRAPHLCALAEALTDVREGRCRRLIVSMPPRHGKSELSTIHFPCWVLGNDPTAEIVCASYSAALAEKHSRRARDIFASPEYQRLFPGVGHVPATAGQQSVAVARQAAHEWGTTQGGSYVAVGVEGSLTGRGADLAIIDDPVKGREEAESPRERERCLDWYRSVLYTRLSPRGAIIIIMTRWHPDDLAGVLLADMASGGEPWRTIRFPAIDANGAALWPERFPLDALAEIQRASPYDWAALYQQEPVRRGGNLFQVDRVQIHDGDVTFPSVPYVRFWDLASTSKEVAKSDPDYTAGALVGVEWRDGARPGHGIPHLWIPDVVAIQAEAPERNRRILAAAEWDGPSVAIGVEAVAGYKDTATTIKDALAGRRSVHQVNVSRDKVVRAAPLEAVFEAGNVHIVRAPWNSLFLSQFSEFPAGGHDDIVDAVSGGYEMLTKRSGHNLQRAAAWNSHGLSRDMAEGF